jgi:hypothetical protein
MSPKKNPFIPEEPAVCICEDLKLWKPDRYYFLKSMVRDDEMFSFDDR